MTVGWMGAALNPLTVSIIFETRGAVSRPEGGGGPTFSTNRRVIPGSFWFARAVLCWRGGGMRRNGEMVFLILVLLILLRMPLLNLPCITPEPSLPSFDNAKIVPAWHMPFHCSLLPLANALWLVFFDANAEIVMCIRRSKLCSLCPQFDRWPKSIPGT